MINESASDAIDTITEIVEFLEGIKDSDRLAARLLDLDKADAGLRARIDALGVLPYEESIYLPTEGYSWNPARTAWVQSLHGFYLVGKGQHVLLDGYNSVSESGQPSPRTDVIYRHGCHLYYGDGSDYLRSFATADALRDKVAQLETKIQQAVDAIPPSGNTVNATADYPPEAGHHTLATAIAAVEAGRRGRGRCITFEAAQGEWVTYQFDGASIDLWEQTGAWNECGGRIRAITLNGREATPDADGTVALTVDTIAVDPSLDPDSTNPVENRAVAAELRKVTDAAIGGVEVLQEDGRNTLNILNRTGGVIATAEFAGGGGGGDTPSTASRITLTASVDRATVKEGDDATLTYSYNHLNADGDPDGVKADITVTVSRGATTRLQQTIKNVSAGTYTLPLGKYLLAGVTDIYVRAECVTADGTRQHSQKYAAVNVVTLSLSSGYSLATAIANGGYRDGDTIEIPYTLTGSGTKEVLMHLDGADTPMSHTVTRSGTVNGSFTIQATPLSPGRHTVQLVAERDGLRSQSIHIDIFKAGPAPAPFFGIKHTRPDGQITKGDGHLRPTVTAGQYEQLSLEFVAYDPAVTPATVIPAIDGTPQAAISAPRSMRQWGTRFTTQGRHTVTFTVASVTCTLDADVTASTVDVAEAQLGMVARLDATGRSNSESADSRAVWTSGDVATRFDGFDWDSNGWIGDALKLANGARAVIGYKPFATDVKATGLTLEITMRVSGVTDRDAPVLSCMDNGKGLLVTASEVSFRTGQTVTYENEDGNTVTRAVKLGTNFADGQWHKVALVIHTAADGRLMELYVNGNRTGADIYDSAFSFRQDTPQEITIDSSHADVEIRRIRAYSRTLSDDEELDNHIVDADTAGEMVALHAENDILGETGGIDIERLRAQGKGVMRIVRPNLLDDVYAENNKKTDFTADIHFHSPYGTEYDFTLRGCYIRIQGTSSTKYPSKNIRIYLNKGTEALSLTVGGVSDPHGGNRYAMRPGAIPVPLLCCKSDYSDSSMSLNTGGARLFNDILKELGLLTPPQRHQYEAAGESLAAVSVRTAIDGIPIDIFCSTADDTEAIYYGQYNLNNEKSKSQDIFGQANVEGFTPALPMTFETLNNTAPMCLFQSADDDAIAATFDAGLETNFPDDVKWAGLTEPQRDAVRRLWGWVRSCVPDNADPDDLPTFVSQKFVEEIEEYFDRDFILTYYLFTDYMLSVDQRAKNMLLRTWDGLKWYITYYDGDTQLGKRNDCFLVYPYTTMRDTWDAEASKYAFEGYGSWLWCLVLANLGDDLRRCASALRGVMTTERVLAMFNDEQSGHWSDRAFNKSGYLKYIAPATQPMYGKTWPFIYALQGSNRAHREYFIRNRFAILDALYGTSNFTSDNIDCYLSRLASDPADTVAVTAAEPYAFGYGTNNSPNIANTGMVAAGEAASFNITGAYTVNDPLRLYGASRMMTLDLSGCAGHFKNALDLGKCSMLRELDLHSSGTGSTGWWLALSGCTALRRIDLRNQRQAKTGGASSSALDLSEQRKLEYLDARGTRVQSINIAKGAPATTLHFPATLTTLRLEMLARLTDAGLTLEGTDAVTTFILSGCPLLDWRGLLARCPNVSRLRVDIGDTWGDAATLRAIKGYGGIDAEGNAVDYCALVGTYRLKAWADDIDTLQAAFPELNIVQREFSVCVFDDTVEFGLADNITSLDTLTGYDYDSDYVPGQHFARIVAGIHAYKCTFNKATGRITARRLADDDFTKYADGTPFDPQFKGSPELADVMLPLGHSWYKGVNDYKNQRKYTIMGSFDAMPHPTYTRMERNTAGELLHRAGGYIDIATVAVGTPLDTVAYTDIATVDTGRVAVDGMRQIRYPGINSSSFGVVFTDSDGIVVGTFCSIISDPDYDFTSGDYLFTDIPDGAAWAYFAYATENAGCDVIVTDSAEIEAIEPGWEEWTRESLYGVYPATIDANNNLRSLSKDGMFLNMNTHNALSESRIKEWKPDGDGDPTTVPDLSGTLYPTEAVWLSRLRGKGYQLMDAKMRDMLSSLWFAFSGTRNVKLTLGSINNGSYTHVPYSTALDSRGCYTSSYPDGDRYPVLFGVRLPHCMDLLDHTAVNAPSYADAYAAHFIPQPSHAVDYRPIYHDPLTGTDRKGKRMPSVIPGYNDRDTSHVRRIAHGRYLDCEPVVVNLPGFVQTWYNSGYRIAGCRTSMLMAGAGDYYAPEMWERSGAVAMCAFGARMAITKCRLCYRGPVDFVSE
ncbi:MAG: LamG domain-containing protein [Muribaculaceae bacterium]